jgi:hypothetical protein
VTTRTDPPLVADERTTMNAFLDCHRVDEARALDQKPTALRWVIAHMLEEYARHNGHADLPRERIDGATGE